MKARRNGSAVAAAPDGNGSGLVWMFTFGSNMLADIIEVRRGVHPKQVLIGRVWGYEFSLCYRGVPCMEPAFATILPSRWQDVCVWGVVYQISRKEMDMIIHSEGPEYELIQVEVDVLDASALAEQNGHKGLTMVAYVLSSKPQPDQTASLTWSARYKDLVVRGAKQKHLPDSYVAFLEAIPHYQRCRVDFALLCILFPVVMSLSLYWRFLMAITPHMPRAVITLLTRVFLMVTKVINPALWVIHDIVPNAWRHSDVALKARQPAGQPGEWFSSHKRELEMQAN